MLALFAFVIACSFSYCSSSPIYPTGTSTVDIADNKLYDQNHPYYRLVFKPSSSIHDINVAEHPISSKQRFANILAQAALAEAEEHPHQQYQMHANNRRHTSQSFHAMRG